MAKNGLSNKVKNKRLGMVSYNNFGSKMIIKDYRGNNDIDILFPEYNWISYNRDCREYDSGNIRCPYEPRVHGIGYPGEGEYKIYDDNGKVSRCYKVWQNMIERCYSKKKQDKCPTYKGCTVCEEWLNFQNFAKWYYENYYEVQNDRVELEKDILVKGNKIYSPETCVFSPRRINTLLLNKRSKRGEYPIGVYFDNYKGKLIANCNITVNGKPIKKKIKEFPPDQVDEAFLCYKTFKEAYIKQVAEEYKELIPEKLYNALINYEVEIDD